LQLFTENDIRETLPFPAFKSGKNYWLEGHVQDIQVLSQRAGITHIGAQVKGQADHVYTLKISVDKQKKEVQFDAQCSCSVGYHCKHVVAVLFYILEKGTLPPNTDANLEAQSDLSYKQLIRKARLPNNMRDWLGSLDEKHISLDANSFPDKLKQRLFYILNFCDSEHPFKNTFPPPLLQLQLTSVRLLKQGGYGQGQPFINNAQATYVRPIDKLILDWLSHSETVLNDPDNEELYYLQGAEVSMMLQTLLRTGRCYWESKHNPPLSAGEPRQAKPHWQIEPDGQQALQYDVQPAADVILALIPPWYIDLEQACCAPLQTGLPDHLATTLLQAPLLKPKDISKVTEVLSLHHVDLPEPIVLDRQKEIAEKPLLHLRLFTLNLNIPKTQRWRYDIETLQLPVASLSFQYGHTPLIGAHVESDLLHHYDPVTETLLKIKRDVPTEQGAIRLLQSKTWQLLGQHHLLKHLPIEPELQQVWILQHLDWPINKATEQSLLDFSLYEVPRLRDDGWHIDIDPHYLFQTVELDDDEDWYLDVQEDKKHIDWFGVELGVHLAGKKHNLLPLLVSWLQNMNPHTLLEKLQSMGDEELISLRLNDNRILPIAVKQIRPILGALTELLTRNPLDASDRLRLFHLQASQLAELENNMKAVRLRWLGGEKLRLLGQQLQEFDGIADIPPPKGFQTELRGYQQIGLNWLQFLRQYNLGGILADDMGLGKTVQTLAHLLYEKEQNRLTQPCLVVAPTSLMLNWFMESKRFAPQLKVVIVHGNERHQYFDKLHEYDLVLTTYSLLLRDKEHLLAQHYHYLILDEAQNIKNPKAKATQLVHQLHARHRLCLTGTPMENHLGELWSLFNFLVPGLLGEQAQFRQLFRQPIEKHNDHHRQQILNKRITPFMLRRTKEAVVKELPKKTEIVRSVPLQGEQANLYETIRLSMHDKVQQAIAQRGLGRSHIVILEALLKLRQICCDPRLLKLEAAQAITTSAKMELLMSLVPEMLEEGRRILLFSQFTSMLSLIEKELKQRKIRYTKLTGQTRDRQAAIERFQGGEVPLFLISLKAGGTGLNLTSADTVIHYDPWWNPAVENQATDRAYRIGQDKPVFVYKLFTTHTVEEKIQGLQERKQALADSLFSGGKGAQSLDNEDLASLFEPLDDL